MATRTTLSWRNVTALTLALLYGQPCAAAGQIIEADRTTEVTVVNYGGRTMYRYYDANGDLVLQDRPPPNYVPDSGEPDLSVQTGIPAAVPAGERQAGDSVPQRRLVPVIAWLLAAATALAAIAVLIAPWIRFRLAERPLERALRRSGMPFFADVQLPNGPHRTIEIDYLARAPAGILVISTLTLRGQLVGTDGGETWTQQHSSERFTFANPMIANRSATKAVQVMIGDTPATGLVIASGAVRFPSGKPAGLHRLSGIRALLDGFREPVADARLLDGAWRTLMRHPHSNRYRPAPAGAGIEGFLRRHWRLCAAGGLSALSVGSMIAALVSQSGAA